MSGDAGRTDAGQGRASCRGRAIGGPRRLNTSTARAWPGSGWQARRSGAGLLSERAAGACRLSKGVRPACAARCRRRSVGRVTGRSLHHSTAAQLPARTACSAAQAASIAVCGARHSSREPSRPRACSALRQGQPGGLIQTISRAVSWRCSRLRSHGASSVSSPQAGVASSSVRPLAGQPPPGNCSSSAGHPVERVGSGGRASTPARHSAAPGRSMKEARPRGGGDGAVASGSRSMAEKQTEMNTVHKYSIHVRDSAPCRSPSAEAPGIGLRVHPVCGEGEGRHARACISHHPCPRRH